ncbi:putative PHD-finger domain-containing protein [Rosellinia necatrix]|uniref:Putative PHD-finger domain-containing protein n=1 Tax=Rosellinia necatrix TaxID=77044 RepID=A0A1W2TPH1_ROSNE|nr:putative PHD-finger domain-containing protein [Rosellinia necatrix]
MASSRKRALRDMAPDEDAQQPPSHPGLLQRIRNSWQFANLFQWIYLFGRVVKIDESIDIDDLEAECLKPQSTVLVDIGLALLKFVSSHRGLTRDLFDEYTRRQYVTKAPDHNPFGVDESPAKFNDFHALLKIRVLQQLTQWVMLHPERIREKMDEQKPSDQTDWRIEPSGWDSEDRTYYILDDNRLYRMTPPSPTLQAWKPKKNTKKAKAAARASKRQRTSRSATQSHDTVGDDTTSDVEEVTGPEDDGFGGAKWECIAVSLKDVQTFLAAIRKTRDDNERILRSTIEEHLLPILEKQEESRKRKALQKEKELLNLEKMAHAKRSSRIAGKAEQQKLQQQAREDEERRQREERTARKEEQRRLKLEKEYNNRARSREERLKERETKRLQHEEDLSQLSEDSKNLSGDGRTSKRRLNAKIAKSKRVLQDLEDEAEDWVFDCICGVYGQVDDGTHSVACERCSIWQHSKCVGISEEEADRDDFHFLCESCRRHQSSRPDTKPGIKLKIAQPDASSTSRRDSTESPIQPPPELAQSSDSIVQIPTKAINRSDVARPAQHVEAVDRSQLPPAPRPSGFPSIPIKVAGQSHALPPVSPYTNGDGVHAFSSPHPALSPPEQSPNKSRVYSTLFIPLSDVENYTSSGSIKLPQKGMFYPPAKSTAQGPLNNLPPTTAGPAASVAVIPDSPPKKPIDIANSHLASTSPSGVASKAFPLSIQTPTSATHGQRSVFSTPQLDRSVFGANDATPSLPPSRNGISPMKRSPPPQQPGTRIHSSPAPAILPPITTLPPSPSEQILTPPIKPAEPTRPGQSTLGSPG